MKCPGQDTMYWNQDAIYSVRCPECDHQVEFFKDDTMRKCDRCGHKFINPNMDFGCASYCQYAEQCIGHLPPEVLAQQDNLMKDRVAVEMKRYFRTDFKRIGHAADVARLAEEIGRHEKGANLSVVLVAAYLHDIGLVEAERKFPGEADRHHQLEGVPVAAKILEKLGSPKKLTEEVLDIIGRHHTPGDNESINFKILYDADLIVNLKEKLKKNPEFAGSIPEIIKSGFMTGTGRDVAETQLKTG